MDPSTFASDVLTVVRNHFATTPFRELIMSDLPGKTYKVLFVCYPQQPTCKRCNKALSITTTLGLTNEYYVGKCTCGWAWQVCYMNTMGTVVTKHEFNNP